MPTASAMTIAHRDHPAVYPLLFNGQKYSLLLLEVKSFPLTSRSGQTDGRTDNYYSNIMITHTQVIHTSRD